MISAQRSHITLPGDTRNRPSSPGATVYIGRILTAGRSEVTALGETLGLDPSHTTYTPLSHLTTATDKARRDAPSIAVCEL
jgi:hypothetical protein